MTHVFTPSASGFCTTCQEQREHCDGTDPAPASPDGPAPKRRARKDDGVPLPAAPPDDEAEDAEADEHLSWCRVDLSAVLDGTWQRPRPAVGARDDGARPVLPGQGAHHRIRGRRRQDLARAPRRRPGDHRRERRRVHRLRGRRGRRRRAADHHGRRPRRHHRPVRVHPARRADRHVRQPGPPGRGARRPQARPWSSSTA